MSIHRTIAIAFVLALTLGSLAGVAPVAAHEENDLDPDQRDHPACEGDKFKVSSEGASPGSHWMSKPVCTGDTGKPHFHSHVPDDDLSVPESRVEGCHDTAREASAQFGGTSEC